VKPRYDLLKIIFEIIRSEHSAVSRTPLMNKKRLSGIQENFGFVYNYRKK
jgi:hypothetical protein